MDELHIPDSFAKQMHDVYGERGAAWIQRIPSIVAACEERWSIEVHPAFALSYNFVAPCTRADRSAAVLKLGFPVKELFSEMAALRHFDGHGIAALFESDEALGAMLIERVEPGDALDANADDVAATSAAAGVMRNLWRPLPAEHLFPTVSDWGKGFQRLRKAFDGGTGPFPTALVAEAEELFASLTATSTEPVLLHGDLHHGNILSAQRAPWLAIDPKGLAGEPVYETGAILRNPAPGFYDWPDAAEATVRRVAQLSEELGFDRARVRGWGLAQAVLSAWWTWEDHGRVGDFALACAGFIAATPA